ncbi:two-component system, sensor histidine kinase YesM [Pseudobutyrivibrio sp. YE44]|uniref:sensor histidine kinase n=1 Tax=Pseudobutyrivibrio sp. YE44 TaxID=1520802 RepID=UPI0008826B38|nr:histidine kinase [Pseudobutyrivibrio sp. YE44]SDB35099.1 two-component system, sensor histidine kinase YesM [Pseudobutyrivibrio sp. YE44]
MAGISSRIGRIIEKTNTKKRLVLFYIVFVIIPIIVSDTLVVSGIYRAEHASQEHIMENEANAINYTFTNQIDQAAKLGNALYSSLYVDDFLNRKYDSNLEYYNAYQKFFDDTLLKLVEGQSGLKFSIYLDNDTITNGGEFQKLSQAYESDWYKYMEASGRNKGLYFGRRKTADGQTARTIYYFQRLNYYNNTSNNFVLVIIDYGKCADSLSNLNYENRAYICDSTKVIMSNSKYSNVNKDYADKKDINKIAFTQEFKLYGQELSIEIINNTNPLISIMKGKWYQFILLLVINLVLPLFVSNLMGTAYKNKLKEQQTVVAKKNAELLALHSQINPHFLFNALESIRMHSLLKQETETSEMVERLAKLQRQYTEWNEDEVSIEKELEFVKAYLELQKYRFGDRLSFDIDVEPECLNLLVPKLTIVTFVENACVHGIESKITPGWIFVRISSDGEFLTMEIEDTGNGMGEEESRNLLRKMRFANIEMLKEKGRVGIINACLRLKMISDEEASFDLDSEPGTGTLVQIRVPVIYLKGLI